MSTTTGEVQPVVSGSWRGPAIQQNEAQSSIAPVDKAGGSTAAKVGDFGEKNGANSSSAAPGASVEIDDQILSFLNGMGIELNTVMGPGGGKVVQVIDRTTGSVIGQIPPENIALIRDKLEELRGILFDGQA